ncbi:MAG: MATE family efflux transporter [Spirochaetales bacterium]|nr:MATE family efflux transporter [Spirochaetales bacterium]
MEVSKEVLFERMPPAKAIFSLTIPMIIGSIVSIIYNLSDTFFVGQLNDPVENAAVTLVNPAMTLFYAITNLFGIGASTLMSRKLGVKEYDNVRRASATGLYFGLFFASLISIFVLIFSNPILLILGSNDETYSVTKEYLFWTVGLGAVPGIMNILFSFIIRSEGRSMHASIGAMSGCFLNIILDPIFILPSGLNLGAAGAGLATFISNCVACLYFLILLVVLRGRTYVSLNPRNVSFNPDILKNIFIVGFPGVVQNNLNIVSLVIFNNLAAGFGTVAVASIVIVNKINLLPIQIIFGFSQGVMPLIAYNHSSKNYVRMKQIIRKLFEITLGLLIIVLAVYFLGAKTIIKAFMDNEEIIGTGSTFLRGYGFAWPFMCIDFVVVGISQAFGMGRYALVFSFFRKALFEIPFILIFCHLFGLFGLAYSTFCAEVLVSIIALLVLSKMMKKHN